MWPPSVGTVSCMYLWTEHPGRDYGNSQAPGKSIPVFRKNVLPIAVVVKLVIQLDINIRGIKRVARILCPHGTIRCYLFRGLLLAARGAQSENCTIFS